MHRAGARLSTCSICKKQEETPGTFPSVVGIGKVCLECGMRKVRCEVCNNEVKLVTSARFNKMVLCLKDYLKELEKYRNHVILTFSEEEMSVEDIFNKAVHSGPDGYTLLAVRRARNSKSVWEAEYEKTEIFMMRCS